MLEESRMVKPVDVRDENMIEKFEDELSSHPITIVLVYADWCGHCTHFKKDIWSKLSSMKNRRVPLASVREDQLPKTSLSNAKINGYPTVLIVDKNKKIADFEDGTNALPNSNDLAKMTELVKKEPSTIFNSLTPKPVEANLTPEASALRAPELTGDTIRKGIRGSQDGGGKVQIGSLIDSLKRFVHGKTSVFTRKRAARKQTRRQKLKRRTTRKQA